ncbi:MAG: hypothetical protein K8T20_10140 [Planctomycetes bacterium]|nr:hypothetical protein [Planctomycetota bacterium]
MKSLLASALSLVLLAGTSYGESPEELAELARQKGRAGLEEIWKVLALRDSPFCDGDQLKARLDYGGVEPKDAWIAVLEVCSTGPTRDVLFLGRTDSGWRSLRHEAFETESEYPATSILDSWQGGAVCAIEEQGRCAMYYGRVHTRWFFVTPDRVSQVLDYCPWEYEFSSGGGHECSVSIASCSKPENTTSISFEFNVKIFFSENHDDPKTSLNFVVRATARIDRETGALKFGCDALGNSWEAVRSLQGRGASLLCKLEPKRILELARTAPESCREFIERCAVECDDRGLGAELEHALRER